ncbi:MAG: endonuclease III [Firmicutes bacterium]|nr:endonuclease III [Bacillota bacterium]
MTYSQRNDGAQNTILAALDILEKLYPDAICSLDYGVNPWRLLIMARLSAQCTDERVNIVSETLFVHYPTAEDMAEADITALEEDVRPCGLYHVKAHDIKSISYDVVHKFGGRVPDTMEDLLSMSGVGRKIANLILGDVYGKGGIVTDTHCIRICGRLGAYPEDMKNPKRAEDILSAIVPTEKQSDFCHRLVNFGRDVCRARAPMCGVCPMSDICAHAKREAGE